MKNLNKIAMACVVAFAALASAGCKEPPPPAIEKTVYVPVKDTVGEQANIARIVALEYELKQTRDSLHLIRDSVGADMFVASYKLGRIKYYTKIASKGNNVRYLRGWIIRVLRED